MKRFSYSLSFGLMAIFLFFYSALSQAAGPVYNFNFYNGDQTTATPTATPMAPPAQQAVVTPPPAPVQVPLAPPVQQAVAVAPKAPAQKYSKGLQVGYMGLSIGEKKNDDDSYGNQDYDWKPKANYFEYNGLAIGVKKQVIKHFSIVPQFTTGKATLVDNDALGNVPVKGKLLGGRLDFILDGKLGDTITLGGGLSVAALRGELEGMGDVNNSGSYTGDFKLDSATLFAKAGLESENFYANAELGYGIASYKYESNDDVNSFTRLKKNDEKIAMVGVSLGMRF